ncbi:MAG: M20/M25/M40 family metallo-hydrolase, partial [Lactobacillus iners]|nr:M20/M25/M40 family metallo-hydrolase [Lactobacillus iners]
MDEKGKLQVLCDLIKINSANGNEIEVAEYLSKLLSQHGLTAKIDAFGNKRANLLLEVGQGKKILGLTGHMDTVSLGDLTKWNTNPLEPTIIGNKLYGRGASDMKSGLAAQAIALIELYNSGELPQGRIRWIVTAGE